MLSQCTKKKILLLSHMFSKIYKEWLTSLSVINTGKGRSRDCGWRCPKVY